MGVDAAKLLSDNWKHFVNNGATKTTVYKEMGVATYDANSGGSTQPEVSAHTVEMVWDEFSFTLTRSPEGSVDDRAIYEIDKKLIFPSLHLPIVPKVGDHVEEGGVAWLVKGVSVDPVTAHYELHVRPLDAT